MQITTRTAVISIDAVQTAYNDAVMSGRMPLAREIGELWLSRLAEQKVVRLAPTIPRLRALQVRIRGRVTAEEANMIKAKHVMAAVTAA